ncbi:MAG: PIN domain-containing protein [Planctomycetota bacterium]
MSDRVFLDTNVLVYADDLDAGSKRDVARSIVERAVRTRSGVLSTQVLQEYFVTATRKLGVAAEDAQRKVELLGSLEVVRIEVPTILGAIELHRLYGFSLRDSLIVECAAVAGCPRLLTEDLHHGQQVRRLTIENPFVD